MSKNNRKSRHAGRVDADEILPEYDFSHDRPNKYASRYAAGSMVVVLEPDVAAVFPSAGEANQALCALARSSRNAGRAGRRLAGAPSKTLHDAGGRA